MDGILNQRICLWYVLNVKVLTGLSPKKLKKKRDDDMSEYLEDWQMQIFNDLDSTSIDMLVEVLEDKIYSLDDKNLLKKEYIGIWQLFRRINTEEEIKFYMQNKKQKD